MEKNQDRGLINSGRIQVEAGAGTLILEAMRDWPAAPTNEFNSCSILSSWLVMVVGLQLCNDVDDVERKF
jgi:hypothetical protein